MDDEIEAGLAEYLATAERVIEAARTAKGDGAWSASDVVGHLADAARVNFGRLHANAAGNEPAPDWDQEGMVVSFGYTSIPVATVCNDFRLHRQAFTAAARDLLSSGLDRDYLLARLRGTRDHDAEHLKQLAG